MYFLENYEQLNMKRINQTPRENWREKLVDQGFLFHSIDDKGNDISSTCDKFIYWREDVAYQFTEKQIDTIEKATNEVHAMCVDALGDLVKKGDLSRIFIPRHVQDLLSDSFVLKEPHVYGRFDFSWNGVGNPKMLEYNADTPTSLLEAAIPQWYWRNDVHPNMTQFNTIHNALVNQWKKVKQELNINSIHLGCFYESQEDVGNVRYMEECCVQAGLETKMFHMPRMGADAQGRFLDDEDSVIEAIFKLYPWEQFFDEELFDQYEHKKTHWIEPIWKAGLSNKAILAILWEKYPNHPNLLETHFELEKMSHKNFVKKPVLSREGCNIDVFVNNQKVESIDGIYKDSGYVYQAYSPVASFDSPEKTGWLDVNRVFTSIGSWVVGDKSVGISLREDISQITKNTAYFVPHYVG